MAACRRAALEAGLSPYIPLDLHGILWGAQPCFQSNSPILSKRQIPVEGAKQASCRLRFRPAQKLGRQYLCEWRPKANEQPNPQRARLAMN
jgi:hypothetical protein